MSPSDPYETCDGAAISAFLPASSGRPKLPLFLCPLGSNSKDIDCRKLWLGGQAVPQIDGKANVAGPQ